MRAAHRRALVDLAARLGLLHGQGAARGVRRPVPRATCRPPGDAVSRARRSCSRRAERRHPVRTLDRGSQRSASRSLRPARRVRARPPRRLRERYALLWLAPGVVLIVLSVWHGLLTRSRADVGIHYPPSALFAVGLAVRDPRAAALLDRALAPVRPEHDARPAPRAARAARRGIGGSIGPSDRRAGPRRGGPAPPGCRNPIRVRRLPPKSCQAAAENLGRSRLEAMRSSW